MEKMLLIVFTIFCSSSVKAYLEFEVPRKAFDAKLYESALDEELCKAQLSYIMSNGTMLRAEFADAGIKTPRGILKGNFVDLGNYHQCVEISANFEPSDIEGKYCMINVPMTQDDLKLPTLPEWPEVWPEWPESWPEFPWPGLVPNTRQNRIMVKNLEMVRAERARYSHLTVLDSDIMRVSEDNALADLAFRLAVCLPKACTTKQFIDTVLINTTAVGLEFTEEFCRLKNDKAFVPGDYAAMAAFGFIILITLLCTSYDLYYTHILGDLKRDSILWKSFSVYTNCRRLLTFNSAPGALECLDGIRALAIIWIIVGHTYSTNISSHFYNRIDVFSWMNSFSVIWILAAPISVDTFFLLSGLLVVYTSVGKMNGRSLLRNLHLFYLHRLLRLFPILAAAIFLQATLFNHLSDGPEWYIIGDKVERCRTYWWSTLTYLQNYLTNTWCIGPTWYLAIDVQMHILSPIVLFWVLGKRKSAWIALTIAMLTIMVVSTTYNYVNRFQPSSFVQTRSAEDAFRYTKYYYINTLTRCSPFFVGMIFGYLLNIVKGKEVRMSKWLVVSGWTCAVAVSAGIIYSAYPITQMDWNSSFWDGIINSFSRPGWAACLGWMIFACTHGYGGPINWFLSLRIWKLPARISYAMYIFHYPIIMIVNATAVSPTHFTVIRYFYRFLADFATTFIVAFIVTVLIDSPFSTFTKLAMKGGPKSRRSEKLEDKEEN